MKKIILTTAICVAFLGSLHAQVQITALKTSLDKQQLEQLKEKCPDCSVYTLENADALLTTGEEVTLSLLIDGFDPLQLDLLDNESILSPELVAESAQKQPTIKLLRGADANKLTRLSAYDGIISGMIEVNDHILYFEPLSNYIAGGEGKVIITESAAYPAAEMLQSDGKLQRLFNADATVTTRAADFENTARIMRLGLEVDAKYRERIPNYERLLKSYVHVMDGVFYNYFKIKIQLVYFDDTPVYETTKHPVAGYITSTNAFLEKWNNIRPWNVGIDHIMLITDYPANSINRGQCYRKSWSGNMGVSYISSPLAILMCHELAHSIGADDYNHPKDKSIMDYSRSENLFFNSTTIAEIKNYVEYCNVPVRIPIPNLQGIDGPTRAGRKSTPTYHAIGAKNHGPYVKYRWQFDGIKINKDITSPYSTMSVLLNYPGGCMIYCTAIDTRYNVTGNTVETHVQISHLIDPNTMNASADQYFTVLTLPGTLLVTEETNDAFRVATNKTLKYQLNSLLTGVSIQQGQVDVGGSINTNSLSKGLYILSLIDGGHTESHKIMIK